MKFKSKKTLVLFLSLALVFTMSTSALAAWSSYQKNNRNNGIADPTPYMGNNPTVNPVYPATSGTVSSGIDTTSVLNGNTAYTLYNGGDVSGTDGGARISAVDVTTSTEDWNIQLDDDADNCQQLSTPYLATGDHILYAAVTYYTNELQGTGVSGWTDSSGAALNDFDFSPGTTTIYYNGLLIPSNYWEPQLATDLSLASSSDTLTGTVTLTDTDYPYESYTFTTSATYGYDFTVCNSGGWMIPPGTYDMKVEIYIDAADDIEGESFEFLVSNWRLYKVEDVDTGSPSANLLESGYGQANSPLTYDGGYLYFGIYEGDRTYCQYDTTGGGGDLLAMTPVSDDFYYAGATVVTVDSTDYVVFGSDSALLYYTPESYFGGTYGCIDLTNDNFNVEGISSAGAVRSSICVDDAETNLYFTSKGTGSTGYIWRATVSSLTSGNPDVDRIDLTANSTSTPVVSDYGYVYTGYYIAFTSGGVEGVSVSGFDAATSMPISVYSGDPVQSSVVAYTYDSSVDYLYFTTNTGTGQGYCYSYDGTAYSEWSSGSGTYTLQGFASDNGYLVFGNDANTFYVIEP